jgi:hypothetical protein
MLYKGAQEIYMQTAILYMSNYDHCREWTIRGYEWVSTMADREWDAVVIENGR